jgi:hypothetical protein
MEDLMAPSCPVLDDARVELQACIRRLLGAGASMIEDQPLKAARVRREVWRARGDSHAFIIKRFTPERSCVERLSLERWLPALGLADISPGLLGVVGGPKARFVWHIYEDLGDGTLDVDDQPPCGGHVVRDRGFLSAMRLHPGLDRVEAAVASMARLHRASVNHAMLGECRYWTGDLGGHFLSASVRDALRALEALTTRLRLSAAHLGTCDALLAALWRLKDEERDRCTQLAAHGGPECLLHGDFGVRNVILQRRGAGWAGRLIDWDHAGVGPASYDLSTFLVQLPLDMRAGALELYRNQSNCADVEWPDHETWNGLFDTAEQSRLANSVIWPALSAIDGEGDSAFEDLSAIASWFAALQPVFAPAPRASQGERE